jgi:putative ABC transport system permease protein
MLLVVAAGLLVRTMRHLDAVELGFDPRNVIAAELNPDFLKDGSVPRVADFQAALIRQARELPGVAALGTGPRPFGGGLGNVVRVAPEDAGVRTSVDPVSPGYMAALRMRVIRGRLFDRSDLGGVPRVAVVNESAARQLWPGVDPVGQPLFIDMPPQELTVVGVVADVRKGGLEQDFRPIVYILQTQTRSMLYTTLLIRADGDPNTVVPAVRTILKRLDPEQPLTRVETLEEILARQTAPRRFMLHLVGLFSIVALSLAMVGIYGVLAESVAQRVPEIGVRMALGATRRTITGMILSQGGWMVVVGVAIGLGGAYASREIMSSFVFGVPTSDAVTYATACAAVMTAALLASALPARRAASVDPVVALRQE